MWDTLTVWACCSMADVQPGEEEAESTRPAGGQQASNGPEGEGAAPAEAEDAGAEPAAPPDAGVPSLALLAGDSPEQGALTGSTAVDGKGEGQTEDVGTGDGEKTGRQGAEEREDEDEHKDGKHEPEPDYMYSGERDKEGLPHGMGRCTYTQTGLVYEGEFQHGITCGEGKLTWPNGSVYLGLVEDGQVRP